MTLLLAIGNPRSTVLISDRRLSADGQLVDDESNKATVVLPNGARFAAAFTGIARYGNFSTEYWMLEALSEAMKPDGVLRLDRFCEIADKAISALPLAPSQRLLHMIIAGYVADTKHTYPALFSINNDGGPRPWGYPIQTVGSFAYGAVRHTRANDFANSYAVAAGWIPVMTVRQMDELANLAKADKPAAAIVAKAVEMIRSAADARLANGTIGKQCSSITLSSDPSVAPTTDYHTAVPVSRVWMPNLVTPDLILAGANVESADGSPMAFPKVGRNQPCPCKSGKKYKRCHGRV